LPRDLTRRKSRAASGDAAYNICPTVSTAPGILRTLVFNGRSLYDAGAFQNYHDMNTEPLVKSDSSQDIEFLLKRWIPIVVSVVIAVMAGYWVGNNDWTPLAKLMSTAIVCFVAFSLQERGWMLIPLTGYLSGRLSLLPLPFAYNDFGIFLALAAYIAHRAMVKTAPVKMGHPLDWIVGINLLWVVSIWIRKPVGFLVFESEYVGARTYVDIILATVAAWIIIQLPESSAQVRRLPYYLLTSASIPAILSLIIFFCPFTFGFIEPFYSQKLTPDWTLGAEIIRFREVCDFGVIWVLVTATHSPLRDMFHLFRLNFYQLILGIAATLAGGFRSSFAAIMGYITLNVWLKGGFRAMFVTSTVFSVFLVILLFGQGRLYSLPLPVQRALSFLPADWATIAAEDARGSSESRFQWWEDVIKYKVIKNWWLGDGIGVRMAEMNIVDELSQLNFFHAVEFYRAYHSGPLQAIIQAGIFGFLLLYTLLIANAVHAWRCFRKARGSPMETICIFLLVQTWWVPFAFLIIFGSYASALTGSTLIAAYIRLVGRMLDQETENAIPA
jgi:hypothetical protein